MTHASSSPTRDPANDGTVARGVALGQRGLTGGELCFNTSMTGYQEIMTDPSYYGQLMMMTQPHIGNYGASAEDMEADTPMVAGFIVRDYPRRHANTQADETLEAFMRRHGLVGIAGVDTRATRAGQGRHECRHLVRGPGRGDAPAEGARLAQHGGPEAGLGGEHRWPVHVLRGPRAADCGVLKQNILRSFRRRGCTVRVVPGDTDLSEVRAWDPDGLFFSNGPGDPRPMSDAIETVGEAIDTGLPIFGICLGHQLMSLAEGIGVYKMHVGHRGANHPVKNLDTGQVEVTTQNHGFAVDPESIAPETARVTHVNLNDDTIEFKTFAGMSLQYHPEASPGPHDSHYHFNRFMELVAEERDVTLPAAATEPAVATA